MAKYVCIWKDNRGVEHPSEELALKAEAQYEIERQREIRQQNLFFKFRSSINGTQLPYLRADYGRYYDDRDMIESNRDRMIEWLIKNEEMIKAVLNG